MKNLFVSLTGSGAYGYAKSAYTYAESLDHLINLSEYIPNGSREPIWNSYRKNPLRIICALRTLFKKEGITRVVAVGKECALLLWITKCTFLHIGPDILCAHITNESAHIAHTKTKPLQALFFKLVYRRVFKYIPFHVCVSKGVRDDLVLNFGIKPENTCVIYPGSASLKIIHKAGTLNFLYIGRLSHEKRVTDIIHALKNIRDQEVSNNVKLHIVGDGPDAAALKNLCEDLSLTEAVIFHGYLADPWSVANSASILVMASKYEGFPTVMAEAASAGIPCVTYDFPSGPAEIIKNGINGYISAKPTPQSLAAAMNMALNTQWDKEAIQSASHPIRETAALWKTVLSPLPAAKN